MDVPARRQFDPALKEALLRQLLLLYPEPAEGRLPVLARLIDPNRPVPGLTIICRLGPIVSGRVALADIITVRSHPNVASLKRARSLQPTDTRTEAGDATIAAEQPPTTTIAADVDGAGTIVAILDWGIDLGHVNLRSPTGETKLLAMWDQRGGRTPMSPTPFRYGREFNRAMIDRALQTDDPYATLGYDPADVDPQRIGTHGTHVADIACGSGQAPGSVPGVAPGADLLFVHLRGSDTRPEDTLGDSVRLVEALAWVAERAGERPIVVNMSLGTTGGPHDQSPLVVQALDAFCAERSGRAVVMSCGNYRASRLHTQGRLGAGQIVEIPWDLPRGRSEPAELEIWYAGSDRFTVSVVHPSGSELARVPLGADAILTDGVRLQGSAFHREADPNNGDNQVDLFVWPNGDPGRWFVRIAGQRVRDGRWHAWIERTLRPSQSTFPASSAVQWSTTNTICNGRLTIAVGAVGSNRHGVVTSPFSSCGPTRDMRVKPDLAAPGEGIVGAKSSAVDASGRRDTAALTTKSGTSMAAPHVTGAVAVLFQITDGRATAAEVRRMLIRHARRPPPRDVAELLCAGAGIVDLPAAVAAMRSPHPSRGADREKS